MTPLRNFWSSSSAHPHAALEATKTRPAQRMPTSLSALYRHGRFLGHALVRKDLKGRKLYAGASGGATWSLSPTQAARVSHPMKKARNVDALRPYSLHELRAIALGILKVERFRSEVEEARRSGA